LFFELFLIGETKMNIEQLPAFRNWLFMSTTYKEQILHIQGSIDTCKLPPVLTSLIAEYVGGKFVHTFTQEPIITYFWQAVLHISQIAKKSPRCRRATQTINKLFGLKGYRELTSQLHVSWIQVESVVERARIHWKENCLLWREATTQTRDVASFPGFEILYDFVCCVCTE